MEFEEPEEGDEEMGMPYEATTSMANSGSRGLGGSKPTPAAGVAEPGGSAGNRKTSSSSSGGRYRECLKNHAVGIGGHAVDGCGEFMAAGEDGTLDALRCAACSCHRNFHRKESDPSSAANAAGGAADPSFHHSPSQFSPYYRTPAGYLHHHHHHLATSHHHRPPPPLALPSTSGGQSREEQDDVSNPSMMMGMMGGGGGGSSAGKKRYRTKFTQEQKDKMLAFAEKVGWRIQKHDEAAVQQFCDETCVKRHVLKVWMHNNKHTLGKKP